MTEKNDKKLETFSLKSSVSHPSLAAAANLSSSRVDSNPDLAGTLTSDSGNDNKLPPRMPSKFKLDVFESEHDLNEGPASPTGDKSELKKRREADIDGGGSPYNEGDDSFDEDKSKGKYNKAYKNEGILTRFTNVYTRNSLFVFVLIVIGFITSVNYLKVAIFGDGLPEIGYHFLPSSDANKLILSNGLKSNAPGAKQYIVVDKSTGLTWTFDDKKDYDNNVVHKNTGLKNLKSERQQFFFLGGPSSIESPLPASFVEAERLRGEPGTLTKDEYRKICMSSWNGVSFGNEDKAFAAQVIRKYAFCYLSSTAKLYLTGFTHLLNIEINLERALFPWLSGAYYTSIPLIERTVINSGANLQSKIETNHILGGEVELASMDKEFLVSNKIQKNFIGHKLTGRTLLDNLRGKGIVMAISTRHVPQLLGMFAQLSYLGGNLPIEIFYRNDLTGHDLFKIRKAASNYKGIVTAINLDNYIPTPWTVGVKGHNTRGLALIYSQFEEIIYLDVDVVLSVEPSKFFDLPKYQDTGLLFFKSRHIKKQHTDAEFLFLKELLYFEPRPASVHHINEDKYKFDSEEIYSHKLSSFTKSLPTLKDHLKDQIHAGVMVIRKTTHIPGLFMAMNALLWPKTAALSSDGSDIFLLGQLMAGNENFALNEHYGVAVGDLERSVGRGQDKIEAYRNRICSSHLGQIDNGGKLLWIDNSFLKCKKSFLKKEGDVIPNDAISDFNVHITSYMVIDEIRDVAHTKGSAIWEPSKECDGTEYCAVKIAYKVQEEGITFLPSSEISDYAIHGRKWIEWSLLK